MEDGEFSVENFYRFVGERKLMGARCKRCGKVIVPPRPICPECYSRDLEWVELSGKGTVETFTIIHVPTLLFEGKEPYAVAIVKLDEGPKIPGVVQGVASPDQLKIGDRVHVEFDTNPQKVPESWPSWPRYYFVKD